MNKDKHGKEFTDWQKSLIKIYLSTHVSKGRGLSSEIKECFRLGKKLYNDNKRQ